MHGLQAISSYRDGVILIQAWTPVGVGFEEIFERGASTRNGGVGCLWLYASVELQDNYIHTIG